MVIAYCELRRIPPMTVGRAFCAAFGPGVPISQRRPLRKSFRMAVDGQLQAEFGVPLPAALDWLTAAACRRAVSAQDLAHFVACLFDLEPLRRSAVQRR